MNKPNKVIVCSMAACFLMLCAMQSQASVRARYIRLEAPVSLRMAVLEIEAYSGGKNILLHDEKITGFGFRGIPLPDERRHTERELTDGKTTGRGLQAGAPDGNYGVNPWVEIDLGREYTIDKIVIKQPIEPAYRDRYLRLLTLMDGRRKVVLSQVFDNRSSVVKQGTITIETDPKNSVAALLGRTVPPAANFWISMSKVMPMIQSPPPSDGATRVAEFKARNSPASIKQLAQRFFAVVDLNLPDLAVVKGKWDAGDAQGALDAYRDHFFKKLAAFPMLQTNRLGINFASTKYPGQADDLIDGAIIYITQNSASGRSYTPGDFNWAYVPTNGSEQEKVAALSVDRSWANIDSFAVSLLEAYAKTGDRKYLQHWAEVSDDWAMHFAKDADASPYNIRDYFPKDPLQIFYYTCFQLNQIAHQHADFVKSLPSATLARLLMPVAEEYGAQYWRQARVLAFNHMFNALAAAYPSSYILNDFYAGERFEREVRQHFERAFTHNITRDGTMIEAGDEGHMPVPLIMGRSYWDMLKNPPAWLTPHFKRRFEDGYRKIDQMVLRNLTPDGYDHRYSDSDGFARAWELMQTVQKFQGGEKLAAFVPQDVFQMPEVRAIYDTVFGRGAHPTSATRQADQKLVMDYYKGSYQGPPKMVSDWMPYIGFYYLRGSWKPDAAFMHIMCQQPNAQSTNGQLWNTEYRYHDFGYPLVTGSPIFVDGQEQDPDYNKTTLEPGSKTARISAAPQDPMNTRWHTSARYDFAEAYYQGAYQTRKTAWNKDWWRSPFSPARPIPSDKVVQGVKSTRQYIQIRPYRLFIVTDRIELQTPGAHQYTVNYSFMSAQSNEQRREADQAARAAAASKKAAKATGEKSGKAAQTRQAPASPSSGVLKPDDADQLIRFTNPSSPGVTVYHFASEPVHYGPSDWRYPIFFRGHVYAGVASHDGDTPHDKSIAGFAQDSMSTQWTAQGNNALVTLLNSHLNDQDQRIANIQSLTSANVAGFQAKMSDGGKVGYATADSGTQLLTVGNVQAEAEAILLVTTASGETTGMAIGVKQITIAGHNVPPPDTDFEFTLKDSQLTDTSVIQRPIVPVRINPQANVFVDSMPVTLSSATPDVDIRYTIDGTEPTADSPLYTGPFIIKTSTQVLARAFRKGVREIPFTAAGTQVSVVSYAWFEKQPYQDATAEGSNLTAGMNYDYLQGSWFKLYSYADRMPATSSGTTRHLMDVSPRKTDGPFGMRYTGYLRVPKDGVYTFHAPDEFVKNIAEPGYDLRLYVDGHEWHLGQGWHGLGEWSIPLRAGAHKLMVTFADARDKDIEKQKSNAWASFPTPWVVWRGTAPVIDISGPGITQQPIPDAWLFHKP